MRVAVDTSTIIAFYKGDKGRDVDTFAAALRSYQACLPPMVLLEALSNHSTRNQVALMLQGLRRVELLPDFWERASLLRSQILKRGLKAKTADTMIAQCCIDAGIPLITRDTDFKHFAKYGGLELV